MLILGLRPGEAVEILGVGIIQLVDPHFAKRGGIDFHPDAVGRTIARSGRDRSGNKQQAPEANRET